MAEHRRGVRVAAVGAVVVITVVMVGLTLGGERVGFSGWSSILLVANATLLCGWITPRDVDRYDTQYPESETTGIPDLDG